MHKQTTTIKHELQKIKKSKQALAVLLFLFIGIVFWIATTVLYSQTTESISPELLKIAEPLNPSLRVETLELIETKKLYSQEELASFTIYKLLLSTDGQTQKIVSIETTQEQLNQEAASALVEERATFLEENLTAEVENSTTEAQIAPESEN